MISIQSNNGARFCDGITRREVLRVGAVGLGGLTLPGLLWLQEAIAATPGEDAVPPARPRSPKANAVIILFLSGGPAHMDMWDLKPAAPREIRGTFQPISTNVPGIQISEHMPRMARLADKYAIIRSMHHETNSHPDAAYWMMVGSPIQRSTSAARLSREDRPHPGSALTKILGSDRDVPPCVMVPEMMQPNGPPRSGQHAGFLGGAYDPYLLHSDPNLPDYSPGNLRRLPQVGIARMDARRALLDAVNRKARHLEDNAVDRYYERAFDMVSSADAQSAFDITKEPEATRDRYGRHVFGQSVLLARRLVEAGVRLVHVNWVRHDDGKGGQGYDSHSDHLNWAKTELLPPTDAAFASLIEDLSIRGMLDETLVIMMGEFGRTPQFNKDGGRDHWCDCFSVVVAGGGIRGGQVLGSSDRTGSYPASDPVIPEDLIATLYHCLGVDPATEIQDTLGRPYRLAEGKPIYPLL